MEGRGGEGGENIIVDLVDRLIVILVGLVFIESVKN